MTGARMMIRHVIIIIGDMTDPGTHEVGLRIASARRVRPSGKRY